MTNRGAVVDAAGLARAGRLATRAGLVEGFGHLSVRLPSGTILVTPQKALALGRPEECCELAVDGSRVGGEGDPPAEVALHLAIYAARPEIAAVARTHPPSILAFSSLGRTLPVVHGLGAFVGILPVHDDHLLCTTAEQGRDVAAGMGSGGVILRGNGLVTVGSTLPEAMVRAFWAQEAAHFYLWAASAGEPRAYTAEQVEARDDPSYRHADRTGGWHRPHSPFQRAWEYYQWRYGDPVDEAVTAR